MGRNNFYVTLLFIVSSSFASCNITAYNEQGNKSIESISETNLDLNAEWRHPHNIAESVLMVSDSLATDEQIALKKSIRAMLNTAGLVVMKNGMLEIMADSDTCVRYGIPPFYLPIIKESLEQTNNSLREWIDEGIVTSEYLDSAFMKTFYKAVE